MSEEPAVYRTHRLDKEQPIDILKYIPAITAVIIFFGLLRLMWFYNDFNVGILNLLDLSEILLSFFDVLWILAGVVILMGLMFLGIFIFGKTPITITFKNELIRSTSIMLFFMGLMAAYYMPVKMFGR